MNCDCHKHGFEDGHYVLSPLPYDIHALEPILDAETLRIHHDRHHAAYVSGANAALQKLQGITRGEVDSVHSAMYTREFIFHLSGHILHHFYWKSMSPNPRNMPSGPLAFAIDRDFGSIDGFSRLFRTLGMSIQGSGWVVLGLDTMSCRLIICAIEKHQDGFAPGFRPLLACDVWEHAYYLRYQNKRVDYLDNFLSILDWNHAEEHYQLCYTS